MNEVKGAMFDMAPFAALRVTWLYQYQGRYPQYPKPIPTLR
jgi:hypothetical protein